MYGGGEGETGVDNAMAEKGFANVGAWILASNVRRFGPNWKAVGAYNAVTPSKQLVYASAIYRRFMQQGR